MSDDLHGALLLGFGYAKEVLANHVEKYGRHPATEAERVSIQADVAIIEAALAAPPAASGEDALKKLALDLHNLATRGPWEKVPPDWPEQRARIMEIVNALRAREGEYRALLIEVMRHTGLPPFPTKDLLTKLLASLRRIASAALDDKGGID